MISDFNYKNQNTAKSYTSNLIGIGKVRIKFLLILAIIVASLFSAQLVFAANLSTDGQKLSVIEDEINKQETENMRLNAQIAQISSLNYLSKKASELGFNKPSHLVNP